MTPLPRRCFDRWDSAAKELVARQNAEGAGVSPLIVTFASPGAVAAWQQLSREARIYYIPLHYITLHDIPFRFIPFHIARYHIVQQQCT